MQSGRRILRLGIRGLVERYGRRGLTGLGRAPVFEVRLRPERPRRVLKRRAEEEKQILHSADDHPSDEQLSLGTPVAASFGMTLD